MKFTVINHSCLFIETEAGSILVDPWLKGSAYWRSWWHYPPSPEIRPEWLAPDYVYFTHHHFDHLHYPSARSLDPRTKVLIPRFGLETMRKEMSGIGFADVRELDHGDAIELGRGVRIASFQYGFDDTVLVVDDGTDVLFNLNDCKIRSTSLRRIVERFGQPTFAFKSYSFAQCYPITYTSSDPAELQIIDRNVYFDDFVGRMREIRPKYAVPFGSMVAFLHPECRDLNQYLVSPYEVQERARTAGLPGTEVVVMSPGDSWSHDAGFTLTDVDWYSDRESHLEALAQEMAPRLEAQTAAEAGRTVDWEAFRTYFTKFVRALPPGAGRLAVKRPIVFEVPSSDLPYWVVDVPHRHVTRQAVPPPDRADLVRINEGVLADAIEKVLVYFVHISTRVRIEVEPGGASSDLAFWGLLGIWELGYLDRKVLMSRRFWGAAWKRRDEGVGALGALMKRGSFSEKMAGQFAEDDAVTAGGA
ncbi:MAG: MBL fold metallo-hydrolase [Actinomycetes bacterium]